MSSVILIRLWRN